MKEVRLTEDEYEVLQLVLKKVVVQGRTGQIGIMHGADRFVSLHVALKKHGREILNSAYSKLGIQSGIRQVNG